MRKIHSNALIAATCLFLMAWGLPSYAAQNGRTAFPPFTEVEKVVLEHFDSIAGHEPGDIISRSQVEPVFRSLERIGWRVDSQTVISGDVLPDGDLLVQQLRTPSGRRFARRLAPVPEGYDRMDRLTRMPRGRQNLDTLIREPDGQLMIKYMTTTKEGRNLGAKLAEAPGGRGFNKPTGRIYTVDMLLDRLETEYKRAAKAAKAKSLSVDAPQKKPAKP